ncbi:hypothetical protein CFOL_v3_32292, partial [Cephalotus follicularis]
RYLGIPLIASKLTYMDCKVLVDKLIKRTSSWLCNSLSFGGRLQLLASVLFSIQVFWVGYSKKGGKVAWRKVCCPKDVGGLDIKDSRAWNRAAIMKIGWDICRRKELMW